MTAGGILAGLASHRGRNECLHACTQCTVRGEFPTLGGKLVIYQKRWIAIFQPHFPLWKSYLGLRTLAELIRTQNALVCFFFGGGMG